MAPDAAALVTRAQRAALLHGLYVIINDAPDALDLAGAVLDAGVRVLQYRAKRGLDAARLQSLRERTRASRALLIVNDDWRAALAFDCDGVHVGPGDEGFMEAATLRSALGERLIGISCGTVEEALRANEEDVDYIGTGAVYATASKSDAGAPIGLAGLRSVIDVSRHPVAAIGGIGRAEIAGVRAAGAAMAAVISAVSAARDARAAAQALVEAWNAGA